MTILHIDLREVGNNQAILRYGWESLNYQKSRSIALSEISDLLLIAERDYYTLLPETTTTTGRRLFRWLNGSDCWLERLFNERPQESLIVLAIATSGNLSHLPWEVLHDEEDFLLAKPFPSILPIRWCYRNKDNPISLANLDDSDPPENRALNLLFMATSPQGILPELNFEQEEASVLAACRRPEIFLRVEESGCLSELKAVLSSYPRNEFDVIHFTGHAGHSDSGPYFITETETGEGYKASAEEIANTLKFNFPYLLFLSGCRTGQRTYRGEDLSLAEELINLGARAIFAWGRPIADIYGTKAAGTLYQALAEGKTVTQAAVLTFQMLLKQNIPDWHLLRLYIADKLPGSLVTPLHTIGRKSAPRFSYRSTFLDSKKTVNVASRESFVGRRRSLQRCLRILSSTADSSCIGILITGMGGYGKSSLAARICDRLTEYTPLVWVGMIDEYSIVHQIANWLEDSELRKSLEKEDSPEPLKFRLRRIFRVLQNLPETPKPLLLILDDFEQNLKENCIELKPHVAECLTAIISSIQESEAPHKIIITCRYKFDFSYSDILFHEPLSSLQGADLQKKTAQLSAFQETFRIPKRYQEKAIYLSSGNPRLLEWFDKLLLESLSKSDQVKDYLTPIFRQLEKSESSEHLEEVFAEVLLKQIDASLMELLQRAKIFNLPIPLKILKEISSDIKDLDFVVDKALKLSLLDIDTSTSYLDANSLICAPKSLPVEEPEDKKLFCQAAKLLYSCWGEGTYADEAHKLEMHRLAVKGNQVALAESLAEELYSEYAKRSLYKEAISSIKHTLTISDSYVLKVRLAASLLSIGEIDSAEENYKEALAKCESDNLALKSKILYGLGEVLMWKGSPKKARSFLRRVVDFQHKNNFHSDKAISIHAIANIYLKQGKRSKAIELYLIALSLEEDNGTVSAIGDTNIQLASAYIQEEDFSRALKHLEEALSIFKGLNDKIGKARVLFEMAEIHALQRESSEALHLYERALAIQSGYGDFSLESTILHNMAFRIYAPIGDIDNAIAYYERALGAADLGRNYYRKAKTLKRYGELLLTSRKNGTSEIDKARQCLIESLEIFKRMATPEAAEVSSVLNNL